MLRGIDRTLALVSWIVAAVLALMLLVGPRVIAEDKGKPAAAGRSPYAAPAAAADGKALFASKCGSCHTLAAAGASGQIGPELDGLGLDAATVAAAMKAGPGAMPSFSLSAAETRAITKFVATASR
jgi:mono/diheme cytochrome c family protein